jgi:hypothetical protein
MPTWDDEHDIPEEEAIIDAYSEELSLEDEIYDPADDELLDRLDEQEDATDFDGDCDFDDESAFGSAGWGTDEYYE